MEEKYYWIWLSLIPNIGIKRIKKLLDIYKKPENIYKLNKERLMKIQGIGESITNSILDINIRKAVDKHIKYMEINNIDIIPIVDKNYPSNLKEIYDPPISLYVKGNKNILNNNNIAIVGCRNASDYGKKAAKYFGYNLSKKGTNIVSGLAKGVDSCAHIGNLSTIMEQTYQQNRSYTHVDKLNTCGKPIAVVGNGLDTVYPKENKELQEKILGLGGIIVSEYPLGTKPNKMNFPARNRIISGLSKRSYCNRSKRKKWNFNNCRFCFRTRKRRLCGSRKY